MGVALLGSSMAFSDDDRYEEREEHGSFFGKFFKKRPDVAPVNNAAYKEECGSCHFAYQPGLLPARSWQKMMGELDNHFEENAELDKPVQEQLTAYLVANAADKSNHKRSVRIMNSLKPDAVPLRISETPYFIRKHDEIPKRMVADNPELGSYSKCKACHANADKGSYDEHDVRIPGFGKWED
jgi:hypothetical protein